MLKVMRSSSRLAGMLRPGAEALPAVPHSPAASAAQHRDVYYRIGMFLFEHRLEPNLVNYGFAHGYVAMEDPAVVAAVDRATEGGLRLSQKIVDEIVGASRAAAPMDRVGVSPGDLARMIGEAQARFEQFAGIVDSSHEDARNFGDALEEAASGAIDVNAVAALLEITNSMIESTRRAEQRLRATAGEMAELRTSLATARQDAETDPLTGLHNRRAFSARFTDARDRALGGGKPLSLALLDIDRFKDVNDRHGHEVGDRVIQMISKELTRGCAGHVVGRHGGEEFVILFEDTPGAVARTLLDATRDGLATRTLKVAGTGRELGRLTFSGGVVTLGEDESCAAAIRRADTLLYRAKQAGRNRIEG